MSGWILFENLDEWNGYRAVKEVKTDRYGKVIDERYVVYGPGGGPPDNYSSAQEACAAIEKIRCNNIRKRFGPQM